MDQLRPSLLGVAAAFCNVLDRAHAPRVTPMMFYAGLFAAIDIAYNLFEHQVLATADAAHVPARMRRIARRRSLTVLAAFTAATLVSSAAPWTGFALICLALVLHVRPDLSSH